MSQVPTTNFESAITRCRSKYDLVRQFLSRTNQALREALEELYALLLSIRSNDAFRAAFYRALASQNMRKSDNEVLLLIEYAFFPHILQPGKDHKADINKASRYATLINKALAANISPTDFVAFARKQGIQKTAEAKSTRDSQPAKRSKGEPGEPPDLTAEPSSWSKVIEPPALWSSVFPEGCRFNSTALALKAVEIDHAAKAQRQRVYITIHVDGERRVVTGITAEPWHGPSPAPMAPIIGITQRRRSERRQATKSCQRARAGPLR